MVHKAQQRKRTEGKATLFRYGGSVYDSKIAENRANRSKVETSDFMSQLPEYCYVYNHGSNLHSY